MVNDDSNLERALNSREVELSYNKYFWLLVIVQERLLTCIQMQVQKLERKFGIQHLLHDPTAN